VIAAYFDDSGTDPRHPALVMGECIATVENWTAFQEEWRCILEEHHLEYFHMTDFDNRQGQFHRDKFPEEHRIPLQVKLLATLKKRIQAIVVAATNKHDYFAAQMERSYGCKIYAYTAYQCLSGVAQWADETGYDAPIAYVFDHGGGSRELGGKGTLDDLRTDIVRDSQLRQRFRIKELESWSYGLMKSLNPLQGADVVAYEAWKDLQNDFFAKKRKYWRIAAEKLITMERVYQGYFGKEEFSANYSRWDSRVHRMAIDPGLDPQT